MIDKIKSMMGEHPRMFVCLLLLILLIVVFCIYRIADKYLNYSETVNENLYTFVGDVRYDFDADITSNRKGEISKVDSKKNINFDSTPIYGKNSVILPKKMLVILGDNNLSEYRTLPYTNIKDGSLITKDFNEKLEHYFMFDGENTYFVSDAGVLKIDDKTVELSSMSFIICDNNSVIYYDYASDSINLVENPSSVVFENSTYYIDVKNDTVGKEGNILPNTLKYIDFISVYGNLHKKG